MSRLSQLSNSKRVRTRVEKDSLGAFEVPVSALYGTQTARALENFPISGRTAPPSLIRAFLKIKRAAAHANELSRVLSRKKQDLIFRAIDQLLEMPEEEWRIHFPIDPYQAGAGTSQNMNVNEVIANLANSFQHVPFGSYHPIHPNDHVNRSQSTNDVFPAAMRLALLEESVPLMKALSLLSGSFEEKSRQFWNFFKAGRTHLQDAVPIRLGQEFRAYSTTLKRCQRWIENARDSLCELGLGGSAVGTGLTVPPPFSRIVIQDLQALTREPLRLTSDLVESTQSQAPVGFYASMLRLLALELTRICNDLRLMASGPATGLAEIYLPVVQPGSSIMPGKVNPSILEMANQTWFSVIGCEQTIALCLQAGQLELNVMMPMMAYSALEATRITTETLQILRTHCIDGITANEPRLRRYFESTSQIATALNPRLGYDRVAQLVQESLDTNRPVLELVREKKLIDESEFPVLLSEIAGEPSPILLHPHPEGRGKQKPGR